MSGHEHFEELCALAASGQIAAEEWQRLREHLAECARCAGTLRDFGKIGAELLAEYSESVPDGVHAGMRSRFLDRARESGAPLSQYPPSPKKTASWRRSSVRIAGLMAASVLLALGGMYVQSRRQRVVQVNAPEASATKTVVAAEPPQPPPDKTAERQLLLDKIHSLERDKQGLEAKLAAAETHDAQTETKLKEVSAALEATNHELASAQSQGALIATRLSEAQSALEKADSRNAAQEIQIRLAKADKEKLAEDLASERAGAEQARVLLAADKNGQGILAARNLHIVDVYDADTKGQRRSFGRIFYVENKELVFYAYDLSDSRHANAEFYAWGAGLSPGQEVARLGILHNDGVGEKRWVLKYNDAAILAKLDSVFVTAETSKNPEKPNGKRVLFAVLAGQPNHP